MDETWYGFAIRTAPPGPPERPGSPGPDEPPEPPDSPRPPGPPGSSGPETPFGSRVVLTVDGDNAAAAALDEIRARYGGCDIDIWVDDRQRAERLHPVLLDAGCRASNDTIFLAHVGPVLVDRPAPPLAISAVRADDNAELRTWASVKLQGFADSDTPPDDAAVGREAEAWRAHAPISRYEVARWKGEPVAILGVHEVEQDRGVFNLTTLPAFRHRGVAQELLRRCVERARAEGARSVSINGDDGGAPVALYRRMGFTDEIYWRRTYTWPGSLGLAGPPAVGG